MRIFLAAIVASLGLASVQPNSEAVTGYGNAVRSIQENFHNFFDSIGKNDQKQSVSYRAVLEKETRKEKRAFDSMKDEFRSARLRNVKQRDGRKNEEGAALKKRETEKNDGHSNVSASSETESKSRSKHLDAPEVLQTGEKRAGKKSSAEKVPPAHLDHTQSDSDEDYSAEDSEDYSDHSDSSDYDSSDYDSDDETSSEKSFLNGMPIFPASVVKGKVEKVHSSKDDETSAKGSLLSGVPIFPTNVVKTKVKKVQSSKDDTDANEYEDYDESDDSTTKKPKKPKKPKKTAKELKEKQKKERKRLEKWNNLTSAERWEKRLAKEERRKAWMHANNVTYINKTKPQGELSSSERWELILAKEERSKLYLEAINLTYVNKSMERLEEYRKKRKERIAREHEMKKKSRKRKARDRFKKRLKEDAERRDTRLVSGTGSREEAHDSVADSSAGRDDRRSRPRYEDRERHGGGRDWDDRRGGYRGGYDRYRPSRYDSRQDRSRESRFRGNDRYDSSYQPEYRRNLREERYSRYRTYDKSWKLQLEKVPDRYERWNLMGGQRGSIRRKPSQYDSNRGPGYGRGYDDRRSNFRRDDRRRDYSRERRDYSRERRDR